LPDTSTVALAPGLAPGTDADQASGLRRMFGTPAQAWELVLQPALRSELPSQALAARAQDWAREVGPTLVIDAARTQVAMALGLRLRFDLEHALAGDCTSSEACVAASEGLWVLPAARALDHALSDAAHGRRVAQAMDLMAAGMRQVMLILPASRANWVRQFAGPARFASGLIPVSHGAEAGTLVLTAVRQALSEAQIDAFHLLFLGMGEAAAGRLLSGMAAIAHRHFGATLLAAKPVPETELAAAGARRSHRSVENLF